MTATRSESLSAYQTRQRLAELGARRDDRDPSGRRYWSPERQTWIRIEPQTANRFRLTYSEGCGC